MDPATSLIPIFLLKQTLKRWLNSLYCVLLLVVMSLEVVLYKASERERYMPVNITRDEIYLTACDVLKP